MDFFHSITPELVNEKSDNIQELLTNDVVTKIPVISSLKNYGDIKDMQLVRFRGLVQNMFDPEIYLEKYEVKTDNQPTEVRNGKFRDGLKLEPNEEISFESEKNAHGERRPMFLISIPGLNDWATNVENKRIANEKHANTEKHSIGWKRPLDESESFGKNNSTDDSDTHLFKKPNPVNVNKEEPHKSCFNDQHFLNSPIADRPGNACIAKFYGDTANISLNSVVEVIGFISLDANLCGSNRQSDEFENFDEVCTMNPPPSLIPRIHVITYRSLKHLNPLLYDEPDLFDSSSQQDCLRILRTAFTQCLFGDEIAADFLLCHLISTVYIRNEETLGQFAINITNFPDINLSAYIQDLYGILADCLPASHYFQVTLDNLNNTDFIPKKDYATGQLNSGLLQLAPHTHLVLDETCLDTGKLETKGFEAVQNIRSLVQNQKITVDFKFYQIDYDVNVPIIIFSEGKSMLASNYHVPLKPDVTTVPHIQDTIIAVKQFLKPRLNDIRCFLTKMRLNDFSMDTENVQMIEDYFLEMRRINNATAEDLHSMMVLSRLVGILQGKQVLDQESWSQADALEKERRTRISTLKKV